MGGRMAEEMHARANAISTKPQPPSSAMPPTPGQENGDTGSGGNGSISAAFPAPAASPSASGAGQEPGNAAGRDAPEAEGGAAGGKVPESAGLQRDVPAGQRNAADGQSPTDSSGIGRALSGASQMQPVSAPSSEGEPAAAAAPREPASETAYVSASRMSMPADSESTRPDSGSPASDAPPGHTPTGASGPKPGSRKRPPKTLPKKTW